MGQGERAHESPCASENNDPRGPWYNKTPDQWPEPFLMEKVTAWRKKFADYSFTDIYELLLADEGYWAEVNGLIANLPIEPGSIHSSLDETFYTFTVPSRGVWADWLNDSTVIARGCHSDGTFPLLHEIFRYAHERPQGMGLELAAMKARYWLKKAAGKVIERNEKVLDTAADLVQNVGELFNAKKSPVLASVSFTTVVGALGALAVAALYFK